MRCGNGGAGSPSRPSGKAREPRLETLSAIERDFEEARRKLPDIGAALRAGCAGLGDPGDAWRRTGVAIVAAMDEGATEPELSYHNRHHTAEAVRAMGSLASIAVTQGRLDRDDALLGIVAMAGHDLDHDGTPPNGGRLERHAAERVGGLAGLAGLEDAACSTIRAVILGTDPAEVAPNLGRALGERPPGSLGPRVDLLRALANEADILASLLPHLGWHLAACLAQERRDSGHGERAGQVEGYSGRLALLRVYDRFTPAGAALGLAVLQAAQVTALAAAAGLPVTASPEDAARLLDGLPPAEARARYLSALATPPAASSSVRV